MIGSILGLILGKSLEEVVFYKQGYLVEVSRTDIQYNLCHRTLVKNAEQKITYFSTKTYVVSTQ